MNGFGAQETSCVQHRMRLNSGNKFNSNHGMYKTDLCATLQVRRHCIKCGKYRYQEIVQ